MKKLTLFLVAIIFVFTLSACGGNDDGGVTCNEGYVQQGEDCVPIQSNDQDPVISAEDVDVTVGDTVDLLDGVTATDPQDGDLSSSVTFTGTYDLNTPGEYDITYSVTDSDNNTATLMITLTVLTVTGCPIHHELIDDACVKIPAQDIVILHGAVYEIDPYHEDFSGTEQQARQERQDEVEEMYNVNIIYRNYSSSAGWGPSRVSAIIQSSVAGDPLGDIYWVTSDWIQELVAGNAIADISGYLNDAGSNIPAQYHDIGEFQGGVYGFESYTPTMDGGLYYNLDLVESLGVANPSQLFLDGEWNWTRFEQWATQVQTALDGQTEEKWALGGALSYYAEAMIPLNGGSLVNKNTGRVSFAQNPALETYTYLTELWDKGLFEPNGTYDAGSPEWQTGKVVMHPGSLWFINSSNRWGGIPFRIGFVPYPAADDYTGDYQSGISGVAVMTVASGMSAEREELVFTVWNELQLWKTPTEEEFAFELNLLTKFNDQLSIDAYIEVYDKVYLDIMNALGISAYGENGWTANINRAIKEGTSRTAVEAIRPVYETALEDYLGE